MAEFTGLNRSTVADIVTDLVAMGVVEENSGSPGRVGRPSLRAEPVATSAFVLAFDLRVDRTLVALIGLGGSMLFEAEQAHEASGVRTMSDIAPAKAIEVIVSLAEIALANAPSDGLWVGTGVSVPGTIDEATGYVRFAPNLGWVEVEFRPMLDAALSQKFAHVPPVVLANDADLGALAEYVRGPHRAVRSLVYLFGDAGLGGGVIVDGRRLRGGTGFAGEFGHMVVNPQGTRCRCGGVGCWESEVGRSALPPPFGPRTDVPPDEAFEQFGHWLGVGITSIVNILNPDVIVLGGLLGEVFPYVSGQVANEIEHALPASRERIRLAIPGTGHESLLIGAAELAFSELMANPARVLASARQAAR